MTSRNDSIKPSLRSNAFDPNRPDIIQPYKALVQSGLFKITIEFTDISISTWAEPLPMALAIDKDLAPKMSLALAKEFAEKHSRLQKPKAAKKKSNDSKELLPAKSLDVRDFSSKDNLQKRINEIFSNMKAGAFITRFFQIKGMNRKEYQAKNPDIPLITMKTFFDDNIRVINNPKADIELVEKSIGDLIRIFSDEKHAKQISENIDLTSRKLLASCSFPGGESNNFNLFKAQEQAPGEDDEENEDAGEEGFGGQTA